MSKFTVLFVVFCSLGLLGGQDGAGGAGYIKLPDGSMVISDPWIKSHKQAEALHPDIVGKIKSMKPILRHYLGDSFIEFIEIEVLHPRVEYRFVSREGFPKHIEGCRQASKIENEPQGVLEHGVSGCTDGRFTWFNADFFTAATIAEQIKLIVHERAHALERLSDYPEEMFHDLISDITRGLAVLILNSDQQRAGEPGDFSISELGLINRMIDSSCKLELSLSKCHFEGGSIVGRSRVLQALTSFDHPVRGAVLQPNEKSIGLPILKSDPSDSTAYSGDTAHGVPHSHGSFMGDDNKSPYVSTHKSLKAALESLEAFRQRRATAVFMGPVQGLEISLLGDARRLPHLSNSFATIGVFGTGRNFKSIAHTDLSHNYTYFLDIREFTTEQELKLYKVSLDSRFVTHYQGSFNELSLDLTSFGEDFLTADSSFLLISSKRVKLDRKISIVELRDLQRRRNILFKNSQARNRDFQPSASQQSYSSNRESKIFVGSDTEFLHDFKFSTSATENAAKEGFGDCSLLSTSKSIDIQDVWEKEVYSMICFK